MRSAKSIQQKVNKGAEAIIDALQKASGSEPILAVAIAALAAAAITTGSGLSKAQLLQAIDIAWDQCQSVRPKEVH